MKTSKLTDIDVNATYRIFANGFGFGRFVKDENPGACRGFVRVCNQSSPERFVVFVTPKKRIPINVYMNDGVFVLRLPFIMKKVETKEVLALFSQKAEDDLKSLQKQMDQVRQDYLENFKFFSEN
jgi:hypothetical protein